MWSVMDLRPEFVAHQLLLVLGFVQEPEVVAGLVIAQKVVLTEIVLMSEAKSIAREHALTLPKNFSFSVRWFIRLKQ